LETVFPEIFTNVLSTGFWSKMKLRTMKILQGIIGDIDTDAEIEKDDLSFSTWIRPKQLTGKFTEEIKYEQSFEDNCIVLSKFINQPVKTLTTKEFFTLIRHYNEQKK